MARRPSVTNPSDPVLWCKEAAARIEADDPKGAIYCYQESLKIRPNIPDVWYNLGLLLEQTGESTAAFGCYAKSSEMFPEDYRFPAERARLLAASGKYLDAVIAVSDALSINPHSALLHANKAGYLIPVRGCRGCSRRSRRSPCHRPAECRSVCKRSERTDNSWKNLRG